MSVVNETKDFSSRKLRDGIIKSRGTRAGDMVIAIICFVMMILCLLPMLHVLACSLSSADALVKNEVFIIPKGWNIEAYRTVLTTPKYVRSLGWTAILTVMCTLLSISLTICCSYPLIYSELKGGKFINFIILFTMYFSAGTIPSYLLLSRLGMLNTPYALIFPNCISVFNVIIMRSFFYGVPDSLREAAEIDGASRMQTFLLIFAPMARPGAIATGILSFLMAWDEFFYSLIFTSSLSSKTMPVAIAEFNGKFTIDYGMISVAGILGSLIPVLITVIFQKYIVLGMTAGGVKE